MKRRSPLKRKTADITFEEDSYAPPKKVPNLDHSYAVSLSKENKRLRTSLAKKNKKIRQLRKKNTRLEIK